MNGHNDTTVIPPALSFELDGGSPAFENHCQYNARSLTVNDRCEDNGKNVNDESSETCFKQSHDSGTDHTEVNGSVFTAHFVSNGYYGFQPLSLALVTEVECQMDVGDLNAVEGEGGSSCHEIIANGNSFEPYRWQKSLAGDDSPCKSFTLLGKRNWDGVTEIHSEVKRIRQEEPSSLTVCVFKEVDCAEMSGDFHDSPYTERNPDFHHPRCNFMQYV